MPRSLARVWRFANGFYGNHHHISAQNPREDKDMNRQVFTRGWTWAHAGPIKRTSYFPYPSWVRQNRMNKGWFMSKLTQILLIAGVVVIAGVTVFLMTWDIPAPSEKVTKTLSNDRFPS
jgi:hypothetical protein